MSTPTPPSITVAFAASGGKATIPVPSQIGIVNGKAAYTTGFPPLTRTDPTAGGIPPSGLDMNGILFDMSANTAWTAAGRIYPFNQEVVDNAGGYGTGAILQSINSTATFFFNALDGNTADPDVDLTGWIPFVAYGQGSAYSALVLAAGTNNDISTGVAAAGFLDLNPTSGPADVTGIQAGYAGQILVVSNIHATNPTTLKALDAGSDPSAQLRLPVDLTLLQYSSASFRYNETLQLWIPM